MNLLSPLRVIALAIGVSSIASAQVAPCGTDAPCGGVFYQREPAQPSWIFARSTFTHDPVTGARVAQYMRKPPVEPLDDPRMITSRYRRIRTNLRGTDGSIDSTYETQNWGNGRGGLDSEWERFHDAWKESYLTGGFYNQQNPGFGGGFPGSGYGGGFPNGGYGYPGTGYGGPMPGYGFPPGQGYGPGYGMPPQGGPWGGQGQYGNGQHGGNHGGGHGHDQDD